MIFAECCTQHQLHTLTTCLQYSLNTAALAMTWSYCSSRIVRYSCLYLSYAELNSCSSDIRSLFVCVFVCASHVCVSSWMYPPIISLLLHLLTMCCWCPWFFSSARTTIFVNVFHLSYCSVLWACGSIGGLLAHTRMCAKIKTWLHQWLLQSKLDLTSYPFTCVC